MAARLVLGLTARTDHNPKGHAVTDTLTGNPQYDAITAAIKAFKFWNYGLDETNPNSEYAEWVPDLAGAIHQAINAAGSTPAT